MLLTGWAGLNVPVQVWPGWGEGCSWRVAVSRLPVGTRSLVLECERARGLEMVEIRMRNRAVLRPKESQ